MFFEGIKYDGFFVLVVDQDQHVKRFINEAKVSSFFRHAKNFKHVKQADYEYRFYKMYPYGFQLIKKFRSQYKGIEFNI